MSKAFIEVELRGAKYKFAPLTIGELERHEASLTSFLADSSYKNFSLLAAPMADSLKHFHPEITTEDVRDLVDLGSFREALEAMMGVSGLRVTAPGEDRPQPVN